MIPAQNTPIDAKLDSASRQARIAKLRLIFERIRTRARVPIEPLFANETANEKAREKATETAKQAPVIQKKPLASSKETTSAVKPPIAAAQPLAAKKSAYQIAEPVARAKPEAAISSAFTAKAADVVPPQPVPPKPSFAATEPIVTMKPEPESVETVVAARNELPHLSSHLGEPESERTMRVAIPDLVLAKEQHEDAAREKEREALWVEELMIDHAISEEEAASDAKTEIRQATSSLQVPTPVNLMQAPVAEAKVVAPPDAATKSTAPKPKRSRVGAVIVGLVLSLLLLGGLWFFLLRRG